MIRPKNKYMEPLFKNKCIYTEENLKEMMKATQNKAFSTCCIGFILSLVMVGLQRLLENGLSFVAMFWFVLVIVIGVLLYIIPLRQARFTYQRHLELYHGESKASTLFYEQEFIVRDLQTNGEHKFKYEQIVGIKETPHLYLLMFPKNMSALIEKDGFEGGSEKDFLQFIENKCKEYKIRREVST